MIEVRDLAVRFGDAPPAVAGVSFAVEAGETFGLVGESGCGKSTVLRALAGLIPDHGGEVRLDGTVLPPVRPRGFYKRVQMVFQDPYGSLHPRQTIQAQLLEPLRNQGWRRRRMRSARRWIRSACRARQPSATRTSCPAASASVWPSPAP